MTAALSVRGLRVGFGGPDVLARLDLDVPAGAVAAVLGPSGCGKTTLLRTVAGFEHAAAGTVRLGERVLSDGSRHVPPERRRIGIVPQEGALFPHLDVAGNVAFGLTGSRRPSGPVRDRVHEMLELVGLRGLESRMPSQLSGGQQQRVALARALAPAPDLVLLDEPFAALDAGLRASLREEVRAVLTAAGTTAVLVTHDQDEALSIADLVCVMRGGVVVQSGTPAQVYEAPADSAVAALLGPATLVPAVLVGGDSGRAHSPLGELAVLRVPAAPPDVPAVPDVTDAGGAGGAGCLVVRPERVVLGEGGRPGVVVRSRFEGATSLVRVRLDPDHAGGAQDLELDARVAAPPAVGDPVRVTVRGPVPFVPDVRERGCG